jgi:hypothetical protein
LSAGDVRAAPDTGQDVRIDDGGVGRITGWCCLEGVCAEQFSWATSTFAEPAAAAVERQLEVHHLFGKPTNWEPVPNTTNPGVLRRARFRVG